MPTDIANFIARSGAFRAPDLAGVDQARYSNALARNQVDRLPQQNREQDLAIQGQEQALSANQVNNAKGILGRQLVMIGTSRSPKQTAMQITASPDFQAAASFLKLPPIQITPDDTDELIGSQAMQLAQALGVDASGMGGAMPAELQTFNAMTQGMPADDVTQARRINLGLASRAGQGRVTMVNNVPTWTGIGDDGQPFQIPLSSLGSEAASAGTIKREEALGTGRGQAQAATEAAAPGVLEAQQELVSVASSLLKNPNTANVFGAIRGRTPTVMQGTLDAEAEVDRMIALLSLENRAKLKGSGAISDFESRMLGQAATVLQDKRISWERAQQELANIAEILNGAASGSDPLGIR